MGRFISQDPIGLASGDANLYRYVGNEATGATDPSGLVAKIELMPEEKSSAPIRKSREPLWSRLWNAVNPINRGRELGGRIGLGIGAAIYGESDQLINLSLDRLRRNRLLEGLANDDPSVNATDALYQLNRLDQSATLKGGLEQVAYIGDGTLAAGELAVETAGYIMDGAGVVVNAVARRSAAAAAAKASKAIAPVRTVQRTNGQLVQEIATRAEAWGARKGLSTTGSVEGTLKHGYADRLLTRYQQMYGNRGLSTEVRYANGVPWQAGDPLKGTIRLDVVEGPLTNPSAVFDYKFGNAVLTPTRINRSIWVYRG